MMDMLRQGTVKIVVAVVIIGVVVLVVNVRDKKNEFDRIEAAVPGWLSKTGCAKIEVEKPSPDTSFVKWAGRDASTATIDCEYVSGSLEYAKYGTTVALRDALRSRPSKARICVAGRTLLEDELADEVEGPGRFYKMCRNLHGTRY